MKFGPTPPALAEGALLAHATTLSDRTLKKGHRLTADDIAALGRAGFGEIVTARLEPGDIGEDEAALRLAEAFRGEGLTVDNAFTGRANLRAAAAGLAVVDVERVHAINAVDEAVTIATVPPWRMVPARGVVAVVKIIPFAVDKAVLDAAAALAGAAGPPVRVAPFAARRFGLIQTTLGDLRESLIEKTVAVTRGRLEPLGCTLERTERVSHDAGAVADSLESFREDGIDVALILGASAIVDRRDVAPSALIRAGGTIVRLGMPVDPGHLTLLGRLGEMHVLGLPGSARSPRMHGFDRVLQRIVAGIEVSDADIANLGAGGLLKERAGRPAAREGRGGGTGESGVAGIVLAAGESRRMGEVNKLLAEIEGVPMVVRAVDAAVASGADPVLVVTGHEEGKIRAALAGRPVRFVHNPDYAAGMSGSLRAALASVPDEAAGALICLGDMPHVTAEHMTRLVEAFEDADEPVICVATHDGKRGNPSLWHRDFFAEMRAIEGDVGARRLIGEHPEAVVEVEFGDPGVLLDIDTPEALAEARKAAR